MLQEKSTDLALLLLRLVFGSLMIANHGWGKLMKFFSDEPLQFADPLGVGVPASLGLATFAEILCSLLIMVGLFTRLAAIPLIVTMLVAAFLVNLPGGLAKMEMTLLYLAVFVALALTGPGWYSLDARWKRVQSLP